MEAMESLKVCIDTDIVIDYLRGKNKNQDILPKIITKHTTCISTISVYELYYGGFYSGKEKPVDDVLAMMHIFDLTRDDSKTAARIHAELSKSGEVLNVKDVLIAGLCVSRAIPLITRNINHFKKIKELNVIDGVSFLNV